MFEVHHLCGPKILSKSKMEIPGNEFPYIIELVFQLLPVYCQKKQWFKEWKAREQKKDYKIRKLDQHYYEACEGRNWDEAKRLFNLGATNDYISEGGTATTALIWLYAFEKKELIDELLQKYPQEFERSMYVMSAVQNYYSTDIRNKLEPCCGMEKWMTVWKHFQWKETELAKEFNQLAKDAALYHTCYARQWTLAVNWIHQGATNNFFNNGGRTALHWAALYGSTNTVKMILDRYEEQIDTKMTNFISPLCQAFWTKHYSIAEIMIKKMAKYPILQLMLNGKGNIAKGLEVITKWTDLERQLKTGFEFIIKAKLTGNRQINRNMAELIEVCTTKYNFSVIKLIQQPFGKNRVAQENLTWRYTKNKNKPLKKSFVASYFKELKITSNIILKKRMEGRVEVNIKNRNFIN